MGLLTVSRFLVLTCLIVLLAHNSEGGRGSFGRGGGGFGRSGGRSGGSSFGRSRPASTPARQPAPSAPVYRAPSYTAPVYRAPVHKPAPAPAPKFTPYQPRPSAPVQHTNERPIGFVNPGGVESRIPSHNVGGSHATPGSSRPIGFVDPASRPPGSQRPIGFEPSVNRQNVGGSHATPGGLPANPPPYPGTNPGANPYNGQRPPTYNEAMGGRPGNPPAYQQHANPSHTYPGVSPSPIGGRPNQGTHTYPGVSPSPIGGNPNRGIHSYPGGTPSPVGNPGYPQQKYYPTQGAAPGSYNPTYQRPGYQGNGYQGPGYHGTGYYQPGYQGPGLPGVPPGYYSPTYIHTTHDNSMSNLATGLALYNLGRSSGHHDHGYYGGHYHDHYYDRNVYQDTYQNNYISDNSGRSRPNYNRNNNNEYVPPVVTRPVQNSAPPPANCFVINATATNQTNVSTVSLNCSVPLPPVPSTISPLHKALVLSNLGRHHQHYVDYHKSTHATQVAKAPATNTTIKPINSTSSLLFSGLTVAFVQTEPRLLASVKNITLTNSTMPLSNVTAMPTPTVASVLLSNVTVPTNITASTTPANISMPLLVQDPKLLSNASVEVTTISSGNSTNDEIPLRTKEEDVVRVSLKQPKINIA